MPKLIIGADIVPTTSNQHIFENAQMEQIVDGSLLDILRNADYRIFNLEVPLTDTKEPIKKCGPNLIASTKSVAGLKQLGIDFLTLANNHILDQGEQGLWSTTEQLDRVGITYAGVGRTSSEAAKPHIVELNGKKIGIYCCAEHEFSIVSNKKSGANPFDPLESLDHIEKLKDRCDYVICLYHGGKEHYRYPSPNLQKICRKIVEKGADLVICQHTHCIGCEEKWRDGTIIYGQGNFLFDRYDNEYWKNSILVQIDLNDNTIKYIPIQKNGIAVEKASEKTAKVILGDLLTRSEQILQENFIERQYAEYSLKMLPGYLYHGDSLYRLIIFRVLNKLSGHRLSNIVMHKKIERSGLALINQYECEPHRELILKALEELTE